MDLVLQSMIVAQLHDVCVAPTTCGAAASPVELPQGTEQRDLGWALDHLDDQDPTEALAAVVRAAAQPDAAQTERRAFPLVEKLAAKHGRAQASAIAVLGAIRDEGAVPVLTSVLQDADPALRELAAWALGQLGAAVGSSVEALRTASQHDASFPVRCRAADAVTAATGARVLPAWVVADDDLFAIGTPTAGEACASVATTLCTAIAVPIDADACLVGLNAGEHGGTVATFPRTALETAPHGTSVDGAPNDPLQLVEVAGEPWLVSGSSAGAVHRIVRSPNGRLRAEPLATFTSVPKWYRVDGATLLVQTADRSVHRITKRGAR
jgi:hypothetical protein